MCCSWCSKPVHGKRKRRRRRALLIVAVAEGGDCSLVGLVQDSTDALAQVEMVEAVRKRCEAKCESVKAHQWW